jgi:hypothetical protein
MDISKIDRNFALSFEAPPDLVWHSVRVKPFVLYGATYSEEEGLYRRLPKTVADATNKGVAHLSKNTAGVRVRFLTNSPYIAVHVDEGFEAPFAHMTICGKCGVSLFVNGEFVKTVMPSYRQIVAGDTAIGGNGVISFDGLLQPYGMKGMYLAEIFFPLYSTVKNLVVGLRDGATIAEPPRYTHEKPVLFYGSSITQGGCASKPGDDYINRLSRMLDTDYINLGFSGSARGERVIAEYIAEQYRSVFVLDYDHNAPTAEHLQNTHFALYETVREKHPETPIILMTMPTIAGHENRPWHSSRRAVILETFERAKALGDKNVYFIDCYGAFGEQVNGECGTVDNCHPDSLGFLRMAEAIYPLLHNLLNGEK